MTSIKIGERAGEFAQNKDVARGIRTDQLLPALESGDNVIVDFKGVTLTTQSFIHALLSEPIRRLGADVLDRIEFTNCGEEVKTLIEIVAEYSQEGLQ